MYLGAWKIFWITTSSCYYVSDHSVEPGTKKKVYCPVYLFSLILACHVRILVGGCDGLRIFFTTPIIAYVYCSGLDRRFLILCQTSWRKLVTLPWCESTRLESSLDLNVNFVSVFWLAGDVTAKICIIAYGIVGRSQNYRIKMEKFNQSIILILVFFPTASLPDCWFNSCPLLSVGVRNLQAVKWILAVVIWLSCNSSWPPTWGSWPHGLKTSVLVKNELLEKRCVCVREKLPVTLAFGHRTYMLKGTYWTGWACPLAFHKDSLFLSLLRWLILEYGRHKRCHWFLNWKLVCLANAGKKIFLWLLLYYSSKMWVF